MHKFPAVTVFFFIGGVIQAFAQNNLTQDTTVPGPNIPAPPSTGSTGRCDVPIPPPDCVVFINPPSSSGGTALDKTIRIDPSIYSTLPKAQLNDLGAPKLNLPMEMKPGIGGSGL